MPQHPWYVLIEAAASLPGLRTGFEEALSAIVDLGVAEDCVIASSGKQRDELWAWRESIPETEKRAGRSAKHDVSVPIAAIPRFVEEATAAVEAHHPGAVVLAFGHIGDGNVHFNVLLPDGATSEAVNATVHAIVKDYRGSITAEHGIGRYRREDLREHRSDAEMQIMRAIKTALDPENRLNPGSIFARESTP
jgi:FAD/FMN-containing dehydrogenase